MRRARRASRSCKLEQKEYVGRGRPGCVAPLPWRRKRRSFGSISGWPFQPGAVRGIAAGTRACGDAGVGAGRAPAEHDRYRICLGRAGRYGEALDVFRKHLPDLPDLRAHGYYAFLLLTLGRLREGWAQCEFRWMQEPHLSNRPGFSSAAMGGAGPGRQDAADDRRAGRRRHHPLCPLCQAAESHGGHGPAEVRPEMAPLAAGFADVDQVFVRPSLPPAIRLPHPLDEHSARARNRAREHSGGRSLPDASIQPKCNNGPGEIERQRIEGRARMGRKSEISARQFPFDCIGQISRSLGRERTYATFRCRSRCRDGELERFPTQATFVNLGAGAGRFHGHGRGHCRNSTWSFASIRRSPISRARWESPCGCCFPRSATFRWLEGRDDSPWYPTMRLFRQRRLGEWEEVVERVAIELARLCERVRCRPASASDRATLPANPRSMTLIAVPKDIARVRNAPRNSAVLSRRRPRGAVHSLVWRIPAAPTGPSFAADFERRARRGGRQRNRHTHRGAGQDGRRRGPRAGL